MIISAIRVEALKLSRSLVGVITTLAVVVGMFVLLGGITAGVAGGSPEMIAQAGPAASLDWKGLLSGATQVASVATILGAGVVLAWMFGREFADGTISSLFGLPVSRSRIALAKLVVYAVWVVLIGIAIPLAVLFLGLLVGYGAPAPETWAALGRLAALTLFSGSITIAVAWVATLTRSLLAAVGATIALIILAQVGALAGAGGWMPVAAPALWAMTDGAAVTMIQLSLSVVVSAVFIVLTCVSWARLQLNR